jgi:transitional endoplasmic reticulum ATPase
MNEVQLEVAKAYPNDSGRGIARLDPDTLLHLKLSPGDIIEIEGADTTAAKVWRADRQDWNTDTVRIDGFTRQRRRTGSSWHRRRRPASSSAPTPPGW